MTRKLIVEAVGTFFFVLVIGMTVVAGSPLAPLAIGSALMVIVYAGGHISGGHYNPAVSLAAMLRGKLASGELLAYWGAQVGGAALAALVVRYLTSGSRITAFSPAVVPALLVEFLFTFALCYVVLNVATARGTEGNSFYGLAIGFTVLIGALSVGSISGGAFNPAVAVGITLIGLSSVSALWILIVANLLGGVAAAWLFNTLDLGDDRAGKTAAK
ncbi:MAG: aquaporin [Gemmatimonadota bacterium]|nr:aquaporin [Gemmatimonadota bacterium]